MIERRLADMCRDRAGHPPLLVRNVRSGNKVLVGKVLFATGIALSAGSDVMPAPTGLE
jgi:hypothetical protein